jgi:gliding motility-associated-like protein
MKYIVTSTLFLLLVSYNAHSQRAKDGNYTVNAANTTLNSYSYLLSNATAGQSAISSSSNTMVGGLFTLNLAPGDLILIIQMQGASLNVDTYATNEYINSNGLFWGPLTSPIGHLNDWNLFQDLWGEVTNYNNAGKFELAEVKSVTGASTINLMCPLVRSYTASGHVQIVRIPRFNNLTLNSNASIVPTLWNGNSGGIVALEINGNLVFNTASKISATGAGFRGGQTEDFTLGAPPGNVNDIGFCASYVSTQGAEKGEGIAGFYTEYDAIYSRYCKSAPANGGGGGGNHNAGGGGGSNVATGTYTGKGVPNPLYNTSWNLEAPGFGGSISSGGGRGGYSGSTIDQNELTIGPNNTAWGGDYRRKEGGLGGHPLALDATRIFAGGGGGAGDQNNSQGGSGGRGGGIAFIKVYGTVSGPGTIEANGAVGQNANSAGLTAPQTSAIKYGNDAAGGAGGGGTIYISNAGTLPPSLTLDSKGGAGGTQVLSVGLFASNPTMEADGPGGGGGGGLISISAGTSPQSVIGGVSGTTNSAHVINFPPNGATGGAAGSSTTNTSFYDIIAANDTICSGGSVALTASTIGNPPPGLLTWYTSAFGNTVVATGNSYTTPVINTTTTYWIGICPGSFRKPVTVYVSTPPTINGVAIVTNSTCLSAGSISGLSATGGTQPYVYTWNGVVSPTASINNLIPGVYTLTVTDALGCANSSIPYTILGTAGPIVNVAGISIVSQSCNGTLGTINGITAQGTNLSYSWTGTASTSINPSNLVAGNYTLTVTDGNGCIASAGPFTIPFISGPTINGTQLQVTDENCFQGNGSISGITANGVGLNYAWSPSGITTNNLSNVSAGNYTLTVTDTNGCTSQYGPVTVTNTSPPSIANTALLTPDDCNQNNGSITGITVSGGTLPYAITWNNTAQTSLDILNLSGGTYTLYVTDVFGCSDSLGPLLISSNGGPSIGMNGLNLAMVQCDGTLGGISGLAASGTGNTYLWSNGTTTLNNPNLTIGTYVLTVTDQNNCTDSISLNITGYSAPLIDATMLSLVQPTCLQLGSISGIQVSNGTGNFSYIWTNTNQNTLDINNLSAGSYTLIVLDLTSNCSDTLSNIILTPPTYPIANFSFTPMDPDLNEVITFTNTSSGNWTIENWLISGQPFNNSPIPYSFSLEGTYPVQLIVSNNLGCADTITQNIVVYDEFTFPNVFTPNSDGSNDFFTIDGLKPNSKLMILNRWGDLVFESNNYQNNWEGDDFNGKALVEGVYTIIFTDNSSSTYYGFFHLIR